MCCVQQPERENSDHIKSSILYAYCMHLAINQQFAHVSKEKELYTKKTLNIHSKSTEKIEKRTLILLTHLHPLKIYENNAYRNPLGVQRTCVHADSRFSVYVFVHRKTDRPF